MDGFTVERPARNQMRSVKPEVRRKKCLFALQPSHFGLKQKRLQFRKTGMKAFDESAQKQFEQTGLILLFAEKRPERGADECNQTGILTSASNLTPAFPSFRSVALGVCSRYSGATVPDSHRVPRHLTAMVGGILSAGFKEQFLFTRNNFFSKQKICARKTCFKSSAFA